MKNDFCKGHIKIRYLPSDFNGSGMLDVEVANRSSRDWISEGECPVSICYHWLDENWNVVVYDGFRTALVPDGLAAGASAIFSAEIDPPENPGAYHLMLSLVRDPMYWFDGADDFHMETVKIRVERDAIRDRHKGTAADPTKMTGANSDRNDSPEIPKMNGFVDQSSLSVIKGSDFVCIKPLDKGRKIGFMHIPKTSGRTMRFLLERVMNLKTYFKDEDRSQYSSRKNFIDPKLPIGENYLAHVSFGTLLIGCPDGQYLTVFREASSRILSLWLYWRNIHSHFVAGSSDWRDRVMRTRGKLVDVLLEPGLACQIDNVSLRMLVYPHKGVPDAGFIDRKNDEELLQLALDRLKRFSYLDVLENPRFEANLRDWLGTELVYNRVNVNQTMPKQLRVPLHGELTPETLEALEARSRLDRALWTVVAAARLPGVDLARLTRDTLIKNVARYSAIMS